MSMPSIEERFRRAAKRSAERSLKASSSFRSVLPIVHDDVPTFIEAPHDEDLANSDVVVCGFPYEGIRARDTRTMIEPGVPLENTVYARDGAWEAPDAIRRHSLHYSLVHAGPNFVGCKNEFVIRRILAVCESSGMSASWGKREERIFPFRGGVQGGSRRVGARRGRTGALARWCPDARPGWGGRRLSVWLVRGALARRRGGVWRSADGLGGGTRSAL